MSIYAETVKKVLDIITFSNSDIEDSSTQDLSTCVRNCKRITERIAGSPKEQNTKGQDASSKSELIQEVIDLILLLLAEIKKEFENSPDEGPRCMSIEDSNNISRLLQFVMKFGVTLHLEPNEHENFPIKHMTSSFSPRDCSSLLFRNCCCIMKICESEPLRNIFILTSLSDIISALMQLCFSPASARLLDTSARKQCLQYLNQVLLSWIPKERAVREILILQGNPSTRIAPKWMRQKCGVMLTRTLLEEGGVSLIILSMVRNFFGESATPSSGGEWERAIALSSILSTLPAKGITSKEFCKLICPQLVDLMSKSRQNLDKTSQETTRIAVATLHAFHEKYHVHTVPLLQELLTKPLDKCCRSKEKNFENDVSEEDLSLCIENLHQICLCTANVDHSLLMTLIHPYLTLLFLVICDTRKTTSHLTMLSMDLVTACLKSMEPTSSAKTFLQLYGEVEDDAMKIPYEDIKFFVSPSGENITSISTMRDPSEILAVQDNKVEALLDILKASGLQDVVGNVFLLLVESICNPARNTPNQLRSDGQLLTEDDKAANGLKSNESRFITFALLTALCETTDPNMLLSNPSKIFSFVKITIENWRISDIATRSSESLKACISVLSLCMLSDMTSNEEEELCGIVPLLQELSSSEALDENTNEIISDLTIAISTYGAVTAGSLNSFSKTLQDQLMAFDKLKSEDTDDDRVDDESNSLKPSKDTSAQAKSGKEANASSSSKTLIEVLHDKSGENLQENHITDTYEKETNHHALKPDATVNEYTPILEKKLPFEQGRDKMNDSSVAEAIDESYDASPALKGGAMRYLTKCLQEKVPEAVKRGEELVKIFFDGLNDSDSFVYLSAVQGLSVIATTSKDRDMSSKLLDRLVAEFLRDSTTHKNKRTSPVKAHNIDVRMKIGEVIMRIITQLGDMAPHHASILLPEFLRGSRHQNPDMRTSCLSNFAQLAPMSAHLLSSMQFEVRDCLCHTSRTDEDSVVRRAAVHTMRQIINSLGSRFLQVMGEVAKDFYRTLKLCYQRDDDTVVQLHAQLALVTLDEIMRNEIFRPPQLTKNISVLPT